MKNKQLRLLVTLLLLMGGTTATMAQSDNIWDTPSQRAAVQRQADNNVIAKTTKRQSNRTSVLKLSAGPSWITSKVYVSWSEYVTSQSGIELSADYENTGSSGWGLGVNCNFNRTTYVDYGSLSLMHLGPSAVYAGMLGRWRLSASICLGLDLCFQKESNTEGGLGLMQRAGVEYMVSNKVGVGLDINSNVSFLHNASGVSLPDDEINGFARYSLLFGIRLYY